VRFCCVLLPLRPSFTCSVALLRTHVTARWCSTLFDRYHVTRVVPLHFARVRTARAVRYVIRCVALPLIDVVDFMRSLGTLYVACCLYRCFTVLLHLFVMQRCSSFCCLAVCSCRVTRCSRRCSLRCSAMPLVIVTVLHFTTLPSLYAHIPIVTRPLRSRTFTWVLIAILRLLGVLPLPFCPPHALCCSRFHCLYRCYVTHVLFTRCHLLLLLYGRLNLPFTPLHSFCVALHIYVVTVPVLRCRCSRTTCCRYYRCAHTPLDFTLRADQFHVAAFAVATTVTRVYARLRSFTQRAFCV